MGKSGSGKSSMRNIIFSNYVAKDVRRLGATIDVEHSSHKFLGNLQLNLWDCGGYILRSPPSTTHRASKLTSSPPTSQDAFTETYLTTQRPHIFTAVGLLIYVFDVESRSFDPPSPDLTTYTATLAALAAHSPTAHVFCLIHKMDLVQADFREKVIADRTAVILGRSQGFEGRVRCFGTSIWDQSLYGAWGGIVHALMPDLDVVEAYLRELMEQTCAEEVVLFERATFLTVLSVVGEVGKKNPYADRQERLSNVIKTFKHSLS